MYEAGWESSLVGGAGGGEGGRGGLRALKKWSVDPDAPDGGILGVAGWVRREKKNEGISLGEGKRKMEYRHIIDRHK